MRMEWAHCVVVIVQKKLALFHLHLQMQAFCSAPHFLWDRAAERGVLTVTSSLIPHLLSAPRISVPTAHSREASITSVALVTRVNELKPLCAKHIVGRVDS